MADLQSSLLANIEAALDSRRMMNVFTSFVTILREQQGKIEELSKRIQQQTSSAAQSEKETSEVFPRLVELEKKVVNIDSLEKKVNEIDQLQKKIDELSQTIKESELSVADPV